MGQENTGEKYCTESELRKEINFRVNDLKQIVVIDKILGIRAIGLVFYGVLPSYLALVGVLNIEIDQFNDFFSPLSIILVSILPISLTFMLIRSLYKEWYLTSDYLTFEAPSLLLWFC